MKPSYSDNVRSWWGTRWIEALHTLGAEWPNRLPRGRSYAEAGRVQDLEISQGLAKARVAGGKARPYRVELQLAVFDDALWQSLVAALAKEMAATVRLLQGEVPQRLETVLADLGVSLFPKDEEDLVSSCTCPDWANPCKHTAAVHYMIGQAMDNDPFLLLELRGRTRRQLFAELQRARANTEVPPSEESDDGTEFLHEAEQGYSFATIEEKLSGEQGSTAFWQWSGAHSPDISFSMEASEMDVPILRSLGAPPSWTIEENFLAVFQPVYEEAAQLAHRLALGTVNAGQTTVTKTTMGLQRSEESETVRPPEAIVEPVPKLSKVCQAIISIAMDIGYVQARDKNQLSPEEQKLFRIALEALVAEERFSKTGYGSATRYVLVENEQ